MRLLKNREILITVIVIAALGLAAAAACLILDMRCALVCAVLTAAVIAVYLVGARRRYRAMERLSDDIDRALAGVENVDLSTYTEGELGILRSQLTKLTVKLRGQTAELKKDKQLLADSIADISHQIKTPLTSMNLLLAALGGQDVSEAKRGEMLTELNRQLTRIDWLVAALLKLARLDAEAVTMSEQPTELSDLIADSLAPIAIQMELKDQTAVVEASGSVVCDRSWTAEALTNIMKNCSEHMGEGRLFITARENPLYSEIVIRDEGPGVDEEDLPHIFERFYRGKNSGKSSVGIGLALSRSIIVKQGGAVKAENAHEGGAQFTVRFYKSAV